tara:strand:- start:677770 stop:678468 length:699 start_codon:yes stop_codon:yes gene_type:complete
MNDTTFVLLLDSISKEPIIVIDDAISLTKYISIDFSIENEELNIIDVSSSKALGMYVDTYLEKHKCQAAYGGYLEKRNIYSRSEYFKNDTLEDERNIHLGIDLWCKEKTKVLAVLNGEIHSFQNNTNVGDYGPTIILKHTVRGVEFYSLYGHLSLDSIKHINVGDSLRQGAVIGTLGTAKVNGDYPPHLHFQLIKDLQYNFGDYPGVSSKKTLDFYAKNCPDPNLLLKLINR